ncbi:MAG: acylglycerol kinase family protein, partial [Treponema sp.]|nr:acylglycerol kinase family protein [Treponema sp.]
MKYVFIFDDNIYSSFEDDFLDAIGQYSRYEKTDFSIFRSKYRRNALMIIEEELELAKAGEVVRVYAAGGDDILFDCLNAVVHYPNMELAVVPYETINDFLRIFGLQNYDSFRDIPTLVKAKTLPTDIIKW